LKGTSAPTSLVKASARRDKRLEMLRLVGVKEKRKRVTATKKPIQDQKWVC